MPKKPHPDAAFWRSVHTRPGFRISCVIVFVGMIGLAIITGNYDSGWGAAQWGPVASWVSGLLTALAVSVALWQGLGNRKEAEANRRAEQAKMIPPIWIAVAELDSRYDQLVEAMRAGQQGISGNSHIRNVKAAIATLTESYNSWNQFTRTVDSVFEPALLAITEPHTQKAITVTYARFSKFLNQCHTEYSCIKNMTDIDFDESARQLKQLRSSRTQVFEIVRRHLLQAPPLELHEY